MRYRGFFVGLLWGLFAPGSGPVCADGEALQGPNGHWYQFVDAGRPISFVDARKGAEAMTYKGFPGHLLTVTSADELVFIVKNVLTPLPSAADCAWLGVTQKRGAAEPAGGWEWVTSEKFEYKNWAPGEPNDNNHNEFQAQIRRDGVWGDVPREMFIPYYVVEFEDPKGLPAPAADDVPQAWNGHYYQLVEAGRRVGWTDAKSIAQTMTYQEMKGHLVTITSAAEEAFVSTTSPARCISLAMWRGWEVRRSRIRRSQQEAGLGSRASRSGLQVGRRDNPTTPARRNRCSRCTGMGCGMITAIARPSILLWSLKDRRGNSGVIFSGTS